MTLPKARSSNKRPGRVVLVVVVLLLVVCILAAGPVVRLVQEYLYPQQYAEEVTHWANEFEVDENLVFAVIKTESGFRPQVQSDVGARGLMQMTDETFEWLKTKIAPDEPLSFDDVFKPSVSIRFGTYYLALCLQRYGGDVATAAAAYHSGWGTVDDLLADDKNTEDGTYLINFPYSQMAHYVNKVMDAYGKYKELYT